MLGGGPTHDGGPDVADAPVMASGVYCGPATTCEGKPICCTGVTTGTSCAVDPAGCGCFTRLACSSDGECSAAQPICCIRSVANPSCGSAVFQSTCSLTCLASGMRLCAPAAPTCPGNKACSTESGSLQTVGLPEGQGFGVCAN